MTAGLEAAHLKRAAMKDAGVKPVLLNPIEKARRNPQSLRLAINGQCYGCVGAGHDPNPINAIRECEIKDCTLWPVRPYQRHNEVDEVE